MASVPCVDDMTAKSVRRKLAAVEQAHGVRILFAVESGSRAWGFPSPDSDYDVRFVYLHRRDWYLSLVERRDVIEIPIDDGRPRHLRLGFPQDAAAAPALEPAAARMAGVADRLSRGRGDHSGAARIGRARLCREWRICAWPIAPRSEAANLKKYFYVIRPLCALIWLVERGTLPPMNLGALLDGIALPAQVRRAIDRLLQQKTRTSELGKGRRLRLLDRWIERQLGRGEKRCNDLPAKTAILAEAEDYFRRVVETHR